MSKRSSNKGRIFFLDFTFNPALRTLQHNDEIVQLRKKQSDVLALLCIKYPEPVSRDDFLEAVWEGGYVTSQSIAQMIRSLRISLRDESKTIISTIPKLGYQLTVRPCWEGTEPVPDKSSSEGFSCGSIELDSICYSLPPMGNIKQPSIDVIPYVVPEIPQSAWKAFSPKVWFISTLVAVFFSLICVVAVAGGFPERWMMQNENMLELSLVCIVPEFKKSFFDSCERFFWKERKDQIYLVSE